MLAACATGHANLVAESHRADPGEGGLRSPGHRRMVGKSGVGDGREYPRSLVGGLDMIRRCLHPFGWAGLFLILLAFTVAGCGPADLAHAFDPAVATAVPPTATPVSLPATPAPPSDTPVPPTAVPPSDTPVPPPPSATPVPPTDTPEPPVAT